MKNSTKTSFKLNELRQLLKQENTLENWCESSRGLTEDESVTEHEQEYRQLMEYIEQQKRDSIKAFLDEAKSQDYTCEAWDHQPGYVSEDLHHLYCFWCDLAEKKKANYKMFINELYKLGYVTENNLICTDWTNGIGIDFGETEESEVRLNLVPNPNASL